MTYTLHLHSSINQESSKSTASPCSTHCLLAVCFQRGCMNVWSLKGKMSFLKTEGWGFIIKSGQTQRINSLRNTPKSDVQFFQTELLKGPFHFRQIDNSMYPPLFYGFPGGSVLRIHPPMQETRVWSLGGVDPLEEEMATHSRILAWRIPRTEEPGGLRQDSPISFHGLVAHFLLIAE